LAQYPVPAINWHDRRTAPSLTQARQRFTGCLVGGVNEWETLQGDPVAIELQVKDAIAQAGREGLIIGAGCVIPVDTPPSNILAVRRAVDGS
ncbi:MAG: uroporphyrinogen decarboxylase family protein, partial [Chloroflexota bacterium]